MTVLIRYIDWTWLISQLTDRWEGRSIASIRDPKHPTESLISRGICCHDKCSGVWRIFKKNPSLPQRMNQESRSISNVSINTPQQHRFIPIKQLGKPKSIKNPQRIHKESERREGQREGELWYNPPPLSLSLSPHSPFNYKPAVEFTCWCTVITNVLINYTC